MVIIQDCDYPGESPIFLTANKRNKIWSECIKECEGHLSRVEFDQIIREVYGEILSPCSNTNLESSSSGFVDTLMETT